MSMRMILACAGWTLAASVAWATETAPTGSAERPGDAAMTCEEIAAELAPYAQQIMPGIEAYGASLSQLNRQSLAMGEQRRAQAEALTGLATLSTIDKTGISKRAYQAAVVAQYAKEKAENEAIMNSAPAKQNKAQGEQMAAQAAELQSNARLQRLMQLGQEKHCDKR